MVTIGAEMTAGEYLRQTTPGCRAVRYKGRLWRIGYTPSGRMVVLSRTVWVKSSWGKVSHNRLLTVRLSPDQIVYAADPGEL